METRKEIAAEKKRCGSHNCTQAVLCTYHDFTGMDEGNIKNAGNRTRHPGQDKINQRNETNYG